MTTRHLLVFGQTALVLAACATTRASAPVETIPLIHLATHIEDYRGHTVRTCGPEFHRAADGRPEWLLTVPGAFGHHPAGVRIVSCPTQSARTDRHGCITGRIARADGSVSLAGDPGPVSSAVISGVWFLHAQCR
jgi:hypothetical protein